MKRESFAIYKCSPEDFSCPAIAFSEAPQQQQSHEAPVRTPQLHCQGSNELSGKLPAALCTWHHFDWPFQRVWAVDLVLMTVPELVRTLAAPPAVGSFCC